MFDAKQGGSWRWRMRGGDAGSRMGAMCASVVMALALTAYAGCGGGGGDDGGGGAPEAGGASGGDPVENVTIGIPSSISGAAVPAGIELGTFRNHGVEVDYEFVGTGAEGIASTVAGDYDVAFANYLSAAAAIDRGIELRLVHEATARPADNITLETLPDSSIRRPEDLVGKTIGVIAIKSHLGLAIERALAELGVDGSKVERVEVPSNRMGAALEQGTVDAVFAIEPLRTTLKNELDTRTVLDLIDGLGENVADTGWFATAKWVKANPEAVAGVQCGLRLASEQIQEDPTIAREVAGDYTEVPPELLAEATLPTYPPRTRVEEVQKLVDLAAESDIVIEEPIDVAAITVDAPETCE